MNRTSTYGSTQAADLTCTRQPILSLHEGLMTGHYAHDTSGLTARQEYNHFAESHASVTNHTLVLLHSIQVAHKTVSKMLRIKQDRVATMMMP